MGSRHDPTMSRAPCPPTPWLTRPSDRSSNRLLVLTSDYETLDFVLHIANRIAEHLQRLDDAGPRILLSDEDVVGIRLAALLRDVGHGPFSHVSEYLLDGT